MDSIVNRAKSRNLFVVCLTLLPTLALSQVVEEASVTEGAGGVIGNGQYQSLFTLGQAGPIGESAGGHFRNRAGFYTTFLLSSSLDADTDGIADEDDPDDDNDALGDAAEISGEAFNPRTNTDPLHPDSDGDGAWDGEESVAGTNPLDGGSQLRLTGVHVLGDDAVITWTSREGYTYRVLSADFVSGLSTNFTIVDTITAGVGTGPWAETVSSSTIPVGSDMEFLCVGVGE